MSIAMCTPQESACPTVAVGRYGPALLQDAEGIWCAGSNTSVSYPDSGHAACLQVEDASFWFRHRNLCIVEVAKRHLAEVDGPLFDVGGGNGFVARGLSDAGFEVVLVEPGLEGARNARRRGLPHVICGTPDSCAFKPKSLPAIGLFDVVEHIEDDVAFLKSLAALLVPRGRVLLTVPSHQWLWSGEDVAAGHFRRYTRGSMTDALQRAGFSVDYASYFFRPLILPILLMRAVPYRLGLRSRGASAQAAAREHGVARSLVTRAMEWVLASEVHALSQGRALAYGASIVVAARLQSCATVHPHPCRHAGRPTRRMRA